MLLCTHSMKDDPVFILHLWETGSHLLRSSDIHSGIWQASPAHTYRAEIKCLSLLVRMRNVPFASGRRQDIKVSPLTSVYKWASVVHHSTSVLSLADAVFSSQLVSLKSQANTSPAWQTSHLCVCMGTARPQSIRAFRLSVHQFAHTVVFAGLSRSDAG